MTPLFWVLAYLLGMPLLALFIGRMIRLADDAQARNLAKRSGRHPSAARPVGPTCLDSDHPCPSNCAPGYPAC